MRPCSCLAALALAGLTSCFPVPEAVPWRPSRFDASSMLGDWHVVATNFPMWLDGERCAPQFSYAALPDLDGAFRMSDRVSYRDAHDGHVGAIEGVDVQSADNPVHFTWRGEGILSLFTSEWYVAWLAPAGDLAIIYFTETPATPAGVDVVARSRTVASSSRNDATAVIAGDPFLSRASAGIVWLGSDDPRVPAACRTNGR